MNIYNDKFSLMELKNSFTEDYKLQQYISLEKNRDTTLAHIVHTN